MKNFSPLVVGIVVGILVGSSSVQAWVAPSSVSGVTARTRTTSPKQMVTTVARPLASSRSSSGALSAMALNSPATTTWTTTPSSTGSPAELEPQDAWIAQLDYEGFGREVAALGKELLQQGGAEDVRHLNKMLRWRDAAALVGLATMWMTPNPLTVLALSTWTYVSWTMVAHHTCHGGYNRVAAGKFNSRGFALGTWQRRLMDWLDWMKPEAWNVEHNRLHHYRLNEVIGDPDLVERNFHFIRDSKIPLPIRYLVVYALSPVWKWTYYAPNTYKELKVAQMKKSGQALPEHFDENIIVTVSDLFKAGPHYEGLRQVMPPREFITQVVGPFFLTRFVLLPAPLLLIPGVGPTLFTHAVINLALAELVTNMHGFLTITTNHAGDDLYTFDDAVKPKTPSFYVRQIVGSANYATGHDWVDFWHGWLNYQIEHHVWPDLSMRQYQKAAPRLKALCEKYGVPYQQQSVWTRLVKTVHVMVGQASMRPFPTRYEPAADKAVSGVSWKSDHGAMEE